MKNNEVASRGPLLCLGPRRFSRVPALLRLSDVYVTKEINDGRPNGGKEVTL